MSCRSASAAATSPVYIYPQPHSTDAACVQVLRRRQVEHTKAERRILGGVDHPFIVSLRFAFHTADKVTGEVDVEGRPTEAQEPPLA
jgi:hypothetical protein